MVTIALRVPWCSQPSRHRWHASCPSWVGLRTEREGEEEESEEGVICNAFYDMYSILSPVKALNTKFQIQQHQNMYSNEVLNPWHVI